MSDTNVVPLRASDARSWEELQIFVAHGFITETGCSLKSLFPVDPDGWEERREKAKLNALLKEVEGTSRDSLIRTYLVTNQGIRYCVYVGHDYPKSHIENSLEAYWLAAKAGSRIGSMFQIIERLENADVVVGTAGTLSATQTDFELSLFEANARNLKALIPETDPTTLLSQLLSGIRVHPWRRRALMMRLEKACGMEMPAPVGGTEVPPPP